MIHYRRRINESSDLWPSEIQDELKELVCKDLADLFSKSLSGSAVDDSVKTVIKGLQPFIEEADSVAEKLYLALKSNREVTINRVLGWMESTKKKFQYTITIDFFDDYNRHSEKKILSAICKSLFRKGLSRNNDLVLKVANGTGTVNLEFDDYDSRLWIVAELGREAIQTKTNENYRQLGCYRNRKIRENYSLRRRRFLKESVTDDLYDKVVKHFRKLLKDHENRNALADVCSSVFPLIANSDDFVQCFVDRLEIYPDISNIKVSKWKIENTWKYSCKVSFNASGRNDGLRLANDICNDLGVTVNNALWHNGISHAKFSAGDNYGDLLISYDERKEEITFTVRVDQERIDREVKF